MLTKITFETKYKHCKVLFKKVKLKYCKVSKKVLYAFQDFEKMQKGGGFHAKELIVVNKEEKYIYIKAKKKCHRCM